MGLVYVANQEGTNLYKIGKTANLKKRLSNMRVNNPNAVIIETVETERYHELEKAVKDLLKTTIPGRQKHKSGEWFELSASWLNVILFELRTKYAELYS